MSKLIQISIEVWLEKITAPAADFSPHELACLEVEMLGKKMRTTEIPLNFPIVFDQRIIFKRMYKHATIMRAVEHLYHDPLGIRLLRRSVSDKEGQTVARYDGSTGNTLLNDTETNSDRAYGSARASQMVDLRICVEGFCFRPKLIFSSFISFREIAASPARYDTLSSQDFRSASETGRRRDTRSQSRNRDRRRNDDSSEEEARRKHSSEGDDHEPPPVRRQPQISRPELNKASPPDMPRPATEPVKSNLLLPPPTKQDFYQPTDWNQLCERPPFVVRHASSGVLGRIPKLHKTMSQETNLMLLQYQLEHPLKQEIQMVCAGKVPVRLYRQLRKHYEDTHHGPDKLKPKTPPLPKMDCLDKYACAIPRLKVVNIRSAHNKRSPLKPSPQSNHQPARPIQTPRVAGMPRKVSDPAQKEQTEQKEQTSLKIQREQRELKEPREQPKAPPVAESGGASKEATDVFNLADVERFLKSTGCHPPSPRTQADLQKAPLRSEKDMRRRSDRDSRQPEENVSDRQSQSTRGAFLSEEADGEPGFVDDPELAAVYRDVTRTLQRDLARRERQVAEQKARRSGEMARRSD